MKSKKYNKTYVILLCLINLITNSGCYINTFYKVSNNNKLSNFKINKAEHTNYRILLTLDPEINKSISMGNIYVYPEYKLESEYELKNTLEANFSENSSDGIANGFGLLSAIVFNTLLISIFGTMYINDINQKKETNYLVAGLFYYGLFNVVYDFSAYKIKEFYLTGPTKKYKDNLLLYTNECDYNTTINNLGKNYIEKFKMSDDKYNINKNNKLLENAIIEFSNNKDIIVIKTDSSGRFIAKKSDIDDIVQKCLSISKVKSNLEEINNLRMTYPYILYKSNYSDIEIKYNDK